MTKSYQARAGETCKHDETLHYVDLLIGGKWTGLPHSSIAVPMHCADAVAAAINMALKAAPVEIIAESPPCKSFSRTEKKLIVTIDGACPGNGQNAQVMGFAAVHSDGRGFYGFSEDKPSNQRAEVMAAITALSTVAHDGPIEIQSDSEYVVKTMRGEFRQKSNLDLWRRLNDLVAPYVAGRLTWTHVRGHNGHPVQERADALAVKAARTRSTNMQ